MNISQFIALALTSVAYDVGRKANFHTEAAKVLHKLAKAIGYERRDYDLRHNQGGIAVSGEITLHSDTLYVQLSQSALGASQGFMWRTCKGRKDYTGGPNQWTPWERLAEPKELAKVMLAHTKKVAL